MSRLPSTIPRMRASHQQLARHDFATPGALVRWLGAVQAQEWPAAKWAVGMRLEDGAVDEVAMDRALADGAFVRTHAFRWTWQLVAPEDVRWILALVRDRLLARAARRHRELGLDAKTIARSNAVIAKALGEGRPLTRAAIGDALQRRGISPAGQRIPHLLGCAELEEIACNGPREGKQFTWRLLDEVAPVELARARSRDDALRELATRYFRSRGPATLADFVWWTGVAVADARAAVEAAAPALAMESIDGEPHWFDASRPVARALGTHLLPAYDEYLVGYRRRDAVLDPEDVKKINAGGGLLGPCVMHEGRIVGTWKRVVTKSGIAVSHELFRASPKVAAAVRRAGERYVRFVSSRVADA